MRFRLLPARILGIAGVILFIGCTGGPKPVPETVPEETTVPVEDPAVEPVTEPPARPEVEPVTQPETKIEAQAKPEAPPEEQPLTVEQPAEVVVTEEMYARTFDELEQRIREWSATIARKDYDTWYANLTRAYIAERGSSTYLAELSKNQKLRDKGVALKDLRDYFLYVVVPARFEAALDRIEFVTQTKVKAYANIGGDPAILYYVVREDGLWKIATSAE